MCRLPMMGTSAIDYASIKKDLEDDIVFRHGMLYGGDGPCTCPEFAKDYQTLLVNFVASESLVSADAKLHALCDFAWEFLEGVYDFETWSRYEPKTECEPQIVALGTICSASLAARGQQVLA